MVAQWVKKKYNLIVAKYASDEVQMKRELEYALTNARANMACAEKTNFIANDERYVKQIIEDIDLFPTPIEMQVKADGGLNVRRQPNTVSDDAPMGLLPDGESIQVYGFFTTPPRKDDETEMEWAVVEYYDKS